MRTNGEPSMVCASCGVENRGGSKFCDNCGSPLAATCPHCGAPNRNDARFCASCGKTLGSEAAPAAEPSTTPAAERRLVTVLFTDLVGFTTLAEDRDPEAVRELLSRYFETATDIVKLHGGTVEKFIGDAVMAVWGTPTAHEDDAERAVRAALELVDAVSTLHPNLQARAGLLTGQAAVTIGATNQGMVAGDLVNTAARLQGVADPGTVLVGEATRRAAESAIVFEPIGDHSLKGKTSPVPAWQALRVVAQRGGHGRTDTLEAPFVGRDEELRQLKEQLHTVGRDRRARLVSITGPGGIGKSRLVWELEKYIDGVSDRIYWHRGRSPSYGEGVTFWALGEMVRRRAQLTEDDDEATTRERIAVTLDEYVEDASERERIGPALLSLLGVEEAPAGGRDTLFPAWRLFFERIAELGTTVLVFEDLQWADTGLLDFIDHLLDWSKGLPIMVVTLARPELFDRRPDWGAGRRQLTTLALEPLTDEAMGELLNGLVPGLPEEALAAIIGRAEGVPLYAVETVRGLLADSRIQRIGDLYEPIGDLTNITVPDSLRSLIASRLDALEPTDRSLLQDAAVLGQVFSADALGAITGSTDDLEPRLRALVRRELLEIEADPRSPERGQYRFVQSLIQEVAYGTLARRDRRSRHLAVARHYEGIGDDELAGVLASHYLAAQEASEEGAEADAVATQARLALTGAADRAAALGGYYQAVTYLDQALAITTGLEDRVHLLDRAARSAAAAARVDAQRYAEEAVAAYRDLADPIGAAGATGRLGKVLIDAGEVQRATQVLEAAVPAAEAIGDQPVLAETLANLSRAYMRVGASEPSVEAADRALAIAERLNLDAVVAEAFVNKGSALNILGRRREAIALQRAALDMAQALGDRSFEMRVRNNLASAISDDDPAGATRMLLEGVELARQIGDRGMFGWLAGTAAAGLYPEGRDWDTHAAVTQEALDAATLRADRIRLRVLHGLHETARGERLDELRVEITELVGDSTDPDDLFSLYMVTANTALMAGDGETAYANALKAAQLPTQSPEVALGLALSAAIWSRDSEHAAQIATQMADAAPTGSYFQALRIHAS
ncbi:MAG TPA: adenylate/guanylate cyclase domain-containing protein, partial [Candidatus Limnocylindrales bacterium]|nr:adenylate/guanylate cyclase domain-containing protein [Candidatus Limnocylindrales bacterium]